MIQELELLNSAILEDLNLKIYNLEEDQECKEYLGFNFTIGSLNYKFRKAKITPKKSGQFVTLWKRNQNGHTEPFHYSDPFDFYIIFTSDNYKNGLFIFPKAVLDENKILSNNHVGKRGFRIYSNWDTTSNAQAFKTQKWQSPYFIDLTEDTNILSKKFCSLTYSELQKS